jgi:hypothetical protein
VRALGLPCALDVSGAKAKCKTRAKRAAGRMRRGLIVRTAISAGESQDPEPQGVVVARPSLLRHARARPACAAEAASARRRPGHPRPSSPGRDVDGRDKPGHDARGWWLAVLLRPWVTGPGLRRDDGRVFSSAVRNEQAVNPQWTTPALTHSAAAAKRMLSSSASRRVCSAIAFLMLSSLMWP